MSTKFELKAGRYMKSITMKSNKPFKISYTRVWSLIPVAGGGASGPAVTRSCGWLANLPIAISRKSCTEGQLQIRRASLIRI